VKYTSVTEALSLVDDRPKDPYYLQRGLYVHKATEYFDRRELDESTVDDEIAGYVRAYTSFRSDSKFRPRLIEYRVFDERYRVAGTLDREGPLNGFEAILDIKSGQESPVDKLQGAAYWTMRGRKGKVFDLYLREDSTYRLKEIERPRLLWPTFLAILTAWRWKEENK
jgi:hypothetical protein